MLKLSDTHCFVVFDLKILSLGWYNVRVYYIARNIYQLL